MLADLPAEKLVLSIVMTGSREPAHWSGKPRKADFFYDLKGIFEAAVDALGIKGLEYRAAQPEGFHPGRTAEIRLSAEGDSTAVGRIGQLHPALQAAKDLEDTYILEVELAPLMDAANFHIEYTMLPRYPAITRDIAVVVDRGAAVGELLAKVREAGGELLEASQVF